MNTTPLSKEQFDHLWEREDKRHQRALNKLRIRLQEYQITCPHLRSDCVFVGDPSGNNDSYYECRKCGKQF